RRAPRDRLRASIDRSGPVDFTHDDPGLAAGAAVGCRRGHWHWSDRDGARSDRGDALVQSSARPGYGHACCQLGDRTASVSAGNRRAHHPFRLAYRARAGRSRTRGDRRCGALSDARPPERYRFAAVWRNGRNASAHERRRSHLAFALAASYAARLRTGADFLGAVRDILCMWLQHQWPDSDALRCALPRLWTCRHRSSERARHDGCVRFCRHDWFGMAFRPLRQSLAPVLVLRSTWTVTALFAIHQFHALWAVALCGVLRPRLDRDRTANGEIDGRPLWPRTRRHGLWLDLHRPSDWRRKRRASRRRGPHGIPDLFAGILRRRCALHHRGDADSRCAEAVFTTDRHGNSAGLRPWRCLEGRKIVSRSGKQLWS